MSSTLFKTPKVSGAYEVAGSSIDSTTEEERVPLSAGDRCLIWLAILATTYTLYAARSILLPIAIAFVVALLLRPLVEGISRFVPRGLAALGALLMVAAFAFLVIVPISRQVQTLGLTNATSVRNYAVQVQERFQPILTWYNDLRDTTKSLESSVDDVAANEATAEETEQIPETLTDRMVELIGGEPAESEATILVQEEKDEPIEVVEKQRPLIDTALGVGADLGASIAANTLLVIILLYFLLAAGDDIIANVVAITPRVTEKKRTLQLVKKVEQGVSTYLLTITAINAGLGVAIGFAMWLLDMPAPWLIGTMAFLFNFVPFVGAIVGCAIVAVVAVIVFPAASEGIFGVSGQVMWGLVPGTYFLLTNLEGNVVTPTLLGQTMKLNPVVVFLALIFWGWIWGIGGALLAVPLLAVLRIWCGHFESTRRFAAVLGD